MYKEDNGYVNECKHNNKVRLLPALNINYNEIDEGLKILKEVIEK